MHKLALFALAASLVAMVSVSFVAADHAAKERPGPSINPFELMLNAGELPNLEVADLV